MPGLGQGSGFSSVKETRDGNDPTYACESAIRNPQWLISVLLVIGAALVPRAAAQTMYVSEAGSFDANGSAARPFAVVQSAVCAGDSAQIAGGLYREVFEIAEPMTLNATGGMVTIGDLGSQTAELKVICYNTHLFGQTIDGLVNSLQELISLVPVIGPIVYDIINEITETTFLDDLRAGQIASLLVAEDADVIGLQEVWDPVLKNTILNGVQPYDSFYGGNVEYEFLDAGDFGQFPIPYALDSGLLLMTQHPMSGKAQVNYAAETEFMESLATKGFLRATLNKAGFSVGVFVTHTQSGAESDSEVVATRLQQLGQLAAAIQNYRSAHPSHAIIVMGDFNISGEGSEYLGNMAAQMGGGAQVIDTARNLACSPFSPISADEAGACTSCADNWLRQYFYPGGAGNGRLDYILYAPSPDGTVDIVPEVYEIRTYQVPVTLPPPFNYTLDLPMSDHYGLFVTFRLYRQ
jgi:endonuclease/exonuclease/phosphatase family metal-dependent hydrolase